MNPISHRSLFSQELFFEKRRVFLEWKDLSKNSFAPVIRNLELDKIYLFIRAKRALDSIVSKYSGKYRDYAIKIIQKSLGTKNRLKYSYKDINETINGKSIFIGDDKLFNMEEFDKYTSYLAMKIGNIIGRIRSKNGNRVKTLTSKIVKQERKNPVKYSSASRVAMIKADDSTVSQFLTVIKRSILKSTQEKKKGKKEIAKGGKYQKKYMEKREWRKKTIKETLQKETEI